VDNVVLSRRIGLLLVVVSCAVLIGQLFNSGDPARRSWDTTAAASTKAGRVAKTSSLGADPDKAVRDVLAYTPFVARGGGKRRLVALTFDDGPGPYTPQVLEALNRRNAKATFFFVGSQERTFHNATIAQIRRGHVVGDHTESHRRLDTLSPRDQYDELLVPFQWLARYGLPKPVLFRPPYGTYNETTFEQAKRLGLLMVMWSVDSQDYRKPGVPAIVQRVVAGVRPGAIVLMHDGGGDRSQTVKAIPRIVNALRARHYHLVTIPELLRQDPPPAGRKPPQLRSQGG